MTTEERLTIIENAVVQLLDSLRQLADTTAEHRFELADHRRSIDLLADTTAEHRRSIDLLADATAEHRFELGEHRRSMERLNEAMITIGDLVALQHQRLEEYRRDSRQMQRLWTHLARKNGWLEDEDWPPSENP